MTERTFMQDWVVKQLSLKGLCVTPSNLHKLKSSYTKNILLASTLIISVGIVTFAIVRVFY